MASLQCTACDAVKPEGEFHRDSSRLKGRDHRCAECSRARWRARHPVKPPKPPKPRKLRDRRAETLRLKYGLTLEDYNQILELQGGACALCGEPFGDRRVCVDHDHSCCPGIKSCGECVRGLLCIACNVGLGTWEKMNRLPVGEYLEAHRG